MKSSLTFLLNIVCFVILTQGVISSVNAQPCNPPAKKSVLRDPAGRYFIYWKPVLPIANTYDVRLKCTNNPPCMFSQIVDPDTALKMNGGWIGIPIPALPSLNSLVKVSIFPEGCDPLFTFTPVNVLDVITDDLEFVNAICDSDTCKITSAKFKNLNALTNYYNAVCGGGGGAVAGSTVTAVFAPVDVTLKRNANGKWQLKLLDPVPCDTCFVFNFQVTCSNGSTSFVQDSVCFTYTGPELGCRLSDGEISLDEISIVPNPINNIGYLEISLEHSAELSINIYNALGQLEENVRSNYFLDAGEYIEPLPVKDLSNGMHIVEVVINNETHRMKLLKF